MIDIKTFLNVPGLRFDLETDRPELHAILESVFSATAPLMRKAVRPLKIVVLKAIRDKDLPNDEYAKVFVDGEYLGVINSEGGLVNYVETIVTDKLARHFTDFALFHSGALTINGKGILLPGASGNGKSTSTTCLAMSGFTYYSDEMAVCSPDGKRLFPFPKLPGLKTGGRQVIEHTFGDTAEKVYSPQIDNVTYFRPPALPTAQDATNGIPIEYVLLPQLPDDRASVVKPIKRSEAMQVLVEESLDLKLRHEAGFAALTAIVNGAECFTVRFGEVRKTVELVRQAVAV